MSETNARSAAGDGRSTCPDEATAPEVVIDTLRGALATAIGGLRRALDFQAATPEGLAIKQDVRHALSNAEQALGRRRPGRPHQASPEGGPVGGPVGDLSPTGLAGRRCPSCGAADEPKDGECSKCGNHCFRGH